MNQTGNWNSQREEMTGEARDETEYTSDPSKEATSVAKRAVEAGQQTASSLSQKLESRAESRKTQTLDRVENIASAIEGVASNLEGKEPWLSERAQSVARGVRRASENLRHKGINELADDVRSWSHNPTVFLGGAFAIGLAAGRFLSSSGHHGALAHRQDQRARPGTQHRRAEHFEPREVVAIPRPSSAPESDRGERLAQPLTDREVRP